MKITQQMSRISYRQNLVDEIIALEFKLKDALIYKEKVDFLQSEVKRMTDEQPIYRMKLDANRVNTDINTLIMNSRMDVLNIIICTTKITVCYEDAVRALKQLYKERDELLEKKEKNDEIIKYYDIILDNVKNIDVITKKIPIVKKELAVIEKLLGWND